LHIGVDLDNTVLDATSSYLFYYNKASGKSFVPEDVQDFYLYRLYGWDETEREKVYHTYGHDIHWHSSPFPMAVEVLRELFIHHEISIITARPSLFQDVTVNWLDYHGITYHRIVFTENKRHECMSSNVDVLIDDAPHYATEFAHHNMPVILFDQPYNSSVNTNLVYRAANWLDVKRILAELESAFR